MLRLIWTLSDADYQLILNCSLSDSDYFSIHSSQWINSQLAANVVFLIERSDTVEIHCRRLMPRFFPTAYYAHDIIALFLNRMIPKYYMCKIFIISAAWGYKLPKYYYVWRQVDWYFGKCILYPVANNRFIIAWISDTTLRLNQKFSRYETEIVDFVLLVAFKIIYNAPSSCCSLAYTFTAAATTTTYTSQGYRVCTAYWWGLISAEANNHMQLLLVGYFRPPQYPITYLWWAFRPLHLNITFTFGVPQSYFLPSINFSVQTF